VKGNRVEGEVEKKRGIVDRIVVFDHLPSRPLSGKGKKNLGELSENRWKGEASFYI